MACAGEPRRGVVSATSSLYTRTDTNATTVWSPRLQVVGQVDPALRVETSYALDAWTGASVDVVTAATRAIHEVRQEVTAGAGYTLGDTVSASGSYRYSTENDYWSHGGVANLTFDLGQHNTVVDVSTFGNRDRVGRAGDALFLRRQATLGARVSLTQVLDAKMLAQLSFESVKVSGYQSSPYRFVAIGGAGTCADAAPLCLPENAPEQRARAAVVVRARRALSRNTSLGVSYRFYFDSWGVRSSTLSPELTWLTDEHGTLSLSYRYYTQGEADFYRPRYLDPDAGSGFFTRDRELSTLYSHRVGLSYQHDVPLPQREAALSFALRAGGTYYRYLAFVGLSHVEALELTALCGWSFR
ncbi:MAG: hypothetical protein RLZZ450_4473 [Pseudomonadota bacterium]|jgi:hypothetical protein